MARCLLAIFIVLLTVTAAFGHGVTCQNIADPAVAVLFAYSDGEPMSYAETKIFGPQSSPDLEFQNGRTDARGIFGFIPDRPGSWRIEASDGMGHKASHDIIIEKTITAHEPGTASDGKPHRAGPGALQILLGVSIIANLALLVKKGKRKL